MADLEQSAEQLFGEALDLQPERRAAFLDQACRGAPELRRLVEELLHENQRMGSFLAQPLLTPETAPPANSARFHPGQLIANRFLVVRFIARGGMGEVYEARDRFLQADLEGRPNVYELVPPRWFEFWKRPAAVRITGNQIPILASAPARDSTGLFVLGRADQGMMQALDPRTGRLEAFLGGLSAGEFVVSPDRQWMAYTEFPTGHLF